LSGAETWPDAAGKRQEKTRTLPGSFRTPRGYQRWKEAAGNIEFLPVLEKETLTLSSIYGLPGSFEGTGRTRKARAVLKVVSEQRLVVGDGGSTVRPTVARWGFSPWFLPWRGGKGKGEGASEVGCGVRKIEFTGGA
jgi:hypothetical protein